MVAKSYQNLAQMGEPFSENGKMYVTVKTASGSNKKVRWYSESEYEKMYGEPIQPVANQKEILGFQKGFITIFRNTNEDMNFYFKKVGARYTRYWGWYMRSCDEIPVVLPEGVTTKVVPWEVVGLPNNRVKPDDAVAKSLESYLYESDGTKYIGSIGERLSLSLVLRKSENIENYFGSSKIYEFADQDNNVYIWFTTSSKTLTIGAKYAGTATVKDQKMYKGTAQNILTNCRLKEA